MSIQAWSFGPLPPVHGCLAPEKIHPASYTFRLPENVSFSEGAMVEPFAIGMQASVRARLKPGDIAAVSGAGPIGMMVALAALAGGCAKVFISDIATPKLKIIGAYDGVETVDATTESLSKRIAEATDGWGADVVFEASGAQSAILDLPGCVRPGRRGGIGGNAGRSRAIRHRGYADQRGPH